MSEIVQAFDWGVKSTRNIELEDVKIFTWEVEEKIDIDWAYEMNNDNINGVNRAIEVRMRRGIYNEPLKDLQEIIDPIEKLLKLK